MPAVDPPRPFEVRLNHIQLGAGRPLWRVTPTDHLDDLFRKDVPDPDNAGRQGGRFDPVLGCAYPFTYVALDPLTAIAETVLRTVRYSAAGGILRRDRYSDRSVSILEPVRELSLISLLGLDDLAAARQDTWLVHAEPKQYPRTRRWAHWFRDCSRRADGIVWPSKRHPGGQVVILFGDDDRCGTALRRAPFGHRPLGTDDGERWLAGLLRPLHTYLRQS